MKALLAAARRVGNAALLSGSLLLLLAPAAARADGYMLVTGYTLSGITASGLPTGPGMASCPRWLELGTQVQIDAIGVVVCADRYPAYMGDHFDVWVPTYEQARLLTGWYSWSLAG